MFTALRRWLQRQMSDPNVSERTVRGMRVIVNNTRPDVETERVYARLDDALGLIERLTPHLFRHLRRDFDQILVLRYACRGAYFPDRNACMVELTFAVNPDFTASQIAATMLHEAMHARLHRLGFPLEMEDRARQERFCRRAEVEFGMMVTDGSGPSIVERALAAINSADEEVAPLIDERLAAQRVADVDRAALSAPEWLRRARAHEEPPPGGAR